MPFDLDDDSGNWWDQMPGADQTGGFTDTTGASAPFQFANTINPGLQGSLSPDELGPLGSTQTVSPDGSLASGATPGSSGATSAASTIQKLLGGGQGQNAANLSSVLGGLSSGIKANRLTQGDFTQKYDQLMLNAQTGRNQNESDALKKLAQTSYLMNGGSKFAPQGLTLNGKTYAAPNLGDGPSPASAAQMSGAASLQGQLGARLAPGGSYMPQPLSGYATPGTGENLASGAAAGLGGLGSILTALGIGGGGGGTGSGGTGTGASGGANPLAAGLGLAGTVGGLAKTAGSATGSTIGGLLGPGLGQAGGSIMGDLLPGVGAATGIYGMLQNKGLGSNLASGAGTGASIGTMVMPGLGTAVGAGVGALAGGLESLLTHNNPSPQELAGRVSQAAATGQLASGASPAQQAEAQKAVQSGAWKDPNQALSLIVMRDALTKQGMPPAQAEQQAEANMHNLWNAESQGGSAVGAAYSPIQSMMAKG